MAGEVLNMNSLDINKHWCNLKDLCFKNRHKTIYLTLPNIKKQKTVLDKKQYYSLKQNTNEK